MKEIHLKISNISHKQWTNLLIELNLVKDSWGRFGPIIDIKAKNFDQIIKWGKKKHGENTNDTDLTVRRDHPARKNRF
jgi:hypothetical protein